MCDNIILKTIWTDRRLLGSVVKIQRKLGQNAGTLDKSRLFGKKEIVPFLSIKRYDYGKGGTY